MVENAALAVAISKPSAIFQRYKYLWFWQPFPVVGHYWNRLESRETLFQLAVVVNVRFVHRNLMISVILSEI